MDKVPGSGREVFNEILSDPRYTLRTSLKALWSEFIITPLNKSAQSKHGFSRNTVATIMRQFMRLLVTDIHPNRAKISLGTARIPSCFKFTDKFSESDLIYMALAAKYGIPVVSADTKLPGQYTGLGVLKHFSTRFLIFDKDFNSAQGLWGQL